MTKRTAAACFAGALAAIMILAFLVLRAGRFTSTGHEKERHSVDPERGDARASRLRGEREGGNSPSPFQPEEHTTVRSALDSLRRAVAENDHMDVQRQIAALARAICASPSQASEALEEAVRASRSGSQRLASDILHGLGRCGDPRVVEVLLEALGSEGMPSALRDSLILSLAQRRDPDLKHEAGAGFAKGDTHVDAAIAEPEVRVALLDLLDETLQDPRRFSAETQANCLFALGASAATDTRVLGRFQSVVATMPDLAPLALLALQMAGKDSKTIAIAEGVIFSPAASEEAVANATRLLFAVYPEVAFNVVVPLLADSQVSNTRKFALLKGMWGLPPVSDALVPELESAVRAADRWTQDGTVTTLQKQSPEEGAPIVELHEDLRLAFATFARGAVLSADGRSDYVARTGADALLYFLQTAPESRQDRLIKTVEDQVQHGGPSFIDHLLTALAEGDLATGVLAPTLLAIRTGSAEEWDSVRARVVALAERLPPGLREQVINDLK